MNGSSDFALRRNKSSESGRDGRVRRPRSPVVLDVAGRTRRDLRVLPVRLIRNGSRIWLCVSELGGTLDRPPSDPSTVPFFFYWDGLRGQRFQFFSRPRGLDGRMIRRMSLPSDTLRTDDALRTLWRTRGYGDRTGYYKKSLRKIPLTHGPSIFISSDNSMRHKSPVSSLIKSGKPPLKQVRQVNLIRQVEVYNCRMVGTYQTNCTVKKELRKRSRTG